MRTLLLLVLSFLILAPLAGAEPTSRTYRYANAAALSAEWHEGQTFPQIQFCNAQACGVSGVDISFTGEDAVLAGPLVTWTLFDDDSAICAEGQQRTPFTISAAPGCRGLSFGMQGTTGTVTVTWTPQWSSD